MGVGAKDTAGTAASDLFLVVIYRFRNCGLILNWRGYWVYRSSICYSWLALWLWICVL